MKKTISVLFIVFASVYSAPKINPISPYVNKGASLHLQMAYNPLTTEFNYKRATSDNQYVAMANDMYLTQKWLRDMYITIGNENEKKEFLASAMINPFRIQAQYKANIFEAGENNLFQNIAISPFGGTAMAYYLYHGLTEHVFTRQNNGYIMLYSGIALGTRKKIIDNFSYIEIFTAPQFSLTYYGGLGGGPDYNPITEINPSWAGTSFSQTMYDFTAPIGVGFKRRWFFVKGGVAISTTFGGEERNVKGGKLTINSHNLPQIPFFAEIGFHFRKFKQLERETND